MKLSKRLLLALTVFGLFQIQTLHASEIHLNIPGVPGESTSQAHQNQIDVLSWGWQISRPAPDMSTGGGGGSPAFYPVTIQKRVDIATPILMMKTLTGEIIDTVELSISRAPAGGPGAEYISIEMNGVTITSVETNSSADSDSPVFESITLVYRSICFTYLPMNADGTTGSPMETCWNLVTNTPE
ncbi:MAG: type VI secretion system tube protein Hcp [Pseudomonadales bacterium]|jgi:type VI secretion system secreted protein Hcp